MIVDVDESLQSLLSSELSRTPGCPVFRVDQITFDRPNDAAALRDGEARVNLYLFSLTENTEFRDESYQRIRKANGIGDAALQRGPVRISLQYLVTAHAGGHPMVEHRLLSDTIGVLLRYAAIPDVYLKGLLEGLGSNAVLMRASQEDDVERINAVALWQAFGAKPQPGISLFVTAPYNPFETRWTKVVRQAVLGVGVGVPPQGPGKPIKTLPLSLSVAGMILDHDSEVPVAGARIEAESEHIAVISDDRGVFTMVNLPVGSMSLTVTAAGYDMVTVSAQIPSAERAEHVDPLIVSIHRRKLGI